MANDGVAVVLYESFKEYLNEELDSGKIVEVGKTFATVFLGSMLLGIISGIVVSMITKYVNFYHRYVYSRIF